MKSSKDSLISFGAGLVAALMTLALSLYSPITLFLAYFIPLPFFIAALIYGTSGTIIATIIGTFLVGLFYGVPVATGFLIINACPALWFAMRNISNEYQKNIGLVISEISIAGIILFLISTVFFSDNILSFVEYFNNQLINNLNSKISVPSMILNLLPSIIVASWIAIIALNLMISKKLSKISKIYKLKGLTLNTNEFIYTSLPNWIIYLFLILLTTSVVLNDITSIWAKSLVVILSVPITLQGLASIQFNINKFTMSNFLTGLFYIIVLFIPFILAIIAAIGVLDHFYDFRKLKNK